MTNRYVLILFLSLIIQRPTGWCQPSEHFIVEKITVEGIRKTRPYVVTELLPYAVGDTLTEDAIHAGVEIIRQSHLFKSVTLKPRAGSMPGYLHLIFVISERYWPTLQFKGGYSELSGWYITPVSLNLDNLSGFGNRISVDLTWGYRIISLTANYLNPNIFDSDLDLIFRLKLNSQQFLYYIQDEQFLHTVGQGGFYTGFRSRSGFFRHVQFGWDRYGVMPDSFVVRTADAQRMDEVPVFIRRYIETKHATSAFTIDFNLDRRDLADYPMHGWWMGIWFTHAVTQLGGTDPFDRLVMDIRAYQRTVGHVVLAGRLKLGAVSGSAPFYEKFYLGGPNSLRGYPDRSLSPNSGGERLLHGNVELRFPITQRHFPQHFLTGALFVDGGSNILTDDSLNRNTLHGSYGFGFRFRLPFIRMLRMDFAWPMNGEESMIQFSIGHTF